ncbi:MAG: type II toxin-antitoxin system HicB family antitoxin [Oculatellaceae cyanobacterium bins.114]|nr:type II toxin-antitoxin system HicB family antitoxin [Oculatellaceae cyanobacterium bins.114]
MLTYKGYTAKVEIDTDAGVLHGRVVDINDTITFEGQTVDDIKREFHTSVDRYLEFCNELGQQPDKPFSGKLPFRTNPDIHRTIYLAATQMDKSINAWMEDVLAAAAQATLDQNSRVTPFEEYEQEQDLARVETKLNQLRDAVKPYVKDEEPETIDRLLMLIAGWLEKDEELRQLIGAVALENADQPLQTWMKQDLETRSTRSSKIHTIAKRKKHRHG